MGGEGGVRGGRGSRAGCGLRRTVMKLGVSRKWRMLKKKKWAQDVDAVKRRTKVKEIRIVGVEGGVGKKSEKAIKFFIKTSFERLPGAPFYSYSSFLFVHS